MPHKKAQTIIELAVFGAMIVFMVGVIVRQSLQFSYFQNQPLRAMRFALATSYQYSEGLKDTRPAAPKKQSIQGLQSRNNASILLIEDRLTADAAKFGTIDRSPYINSASGTFSRNLFMSQDIGEYYNLPVFDMMVNGIHFPFTTGTLKDMSRIDPSTGKNYEYFYTIVPNNYLETNWCITRPCPCIDKTKEPPCATFDPEKRFDLRRCSVDRGTEPDCASPGPINVDSSEYKNFAWQWNAVLSKDLRLGKANDKKKKKNAKKEIALVDLDKDLKEEIVVEMSLKSNRIYYIDNQEGDMDFTASEHDGKPLPGIQSDVSMMTKTKDGTYLLIRDGRLFTPGNQLISTASKKNSIDIIQRIIQLSNNTGRFCDVDGKDALGNPANGVITNLKIWSNDYERNINSSPADVRNPVEACDNCFDPANIDKTCMERLPKDLKGNLLPPIIYVRSRIVDNHGRNWVTDKTSDFYIRFRGE